MSTEGVRASLRRALEAAPDDVDLRLHYAQLLAADGQRDEAVRHAAGVLQRDPTNAAALALLGAPPAGPVAGSGVGPRDPDGVLQQLEADLTGVVPPRYADSGDGGGDGGGDPGTARPAGPGLRLADVAGMDDVKRRLEAAVFAPMRNPELGRLYRKSVRGGLLLYGPPGCGKTFIARAVAGELGAQLVSVSLADVLDRYVGGSEQNIRDVFARARRSAPCVVFLDEADAIGQKRSQRRDSATRGALNQLLTEMDGIADDGAGVFVLGATNHPWDVDVALRRPGRFDRMLLVLPPDRAAREAVLRHHLDDRPIAEVDVADLARRTDGYSGADLAYVCEVAAERALTDSVATGRVRLITMADLAAALAEVRPSTGPWFDTARNVAEFANQDGTYDELASYLRAHRR